MHRIWIKIILIENHPLFYCTVWFGISYILKLILLARNEVPGIILIHCGGNDIGQAHNTLSGLQNILSIKLWQNCSFTPHSLIYFVRNNWVNCLSSTEGQICRRMIDGACTCATFVIDKFWGRDASIRYPGISVQHKELFRKDGVHLSDLDTTILINTVRNALDHFIRCNFVSPTFSQCMSWANVVLMNAFSVKYSAFHDFALVSSEEYWGLI